MDVRVRLVFAEDVGRHVQRQCGFSSCWYLIPKDVKLVGDLSHVLLREFGLRKCCPMGLELRLEELLILATQSIRIVRDNDTIVVQCPLLGDEEADDSETLNIESKLKNLKQRKRKAHERKKELCKKKVKRTQEGKKVNNEWKKRETEACGVVKTLIESKKRSSSSSSDDSSIENSSSESKDESMTQRNRKKVVQDATGSKQLRNKRNDGSVVCRKRVVLDDVASKTNATTRKSEKEPRRRRRRLRQRNGSRQRNGNQVNIANSAASIGPSYGDKDTTLQAEKHVGSTPHVLRKEIASTVKQNGSINAGAKCKLRAKTHVLFDEETGEQVEVDYDEHQGDARGRVEITQRPQAYPEMAKYGPSSSSNHRLRIDCEGSLAFSSGPINGDKEAGVYKNAIEREGKKSKYVEKWKRPYKIVATVLDKKSENSTLSSTDLSKLLDSYPTASASSFQFVSKDVIAFKTLTLCLETWQPILSDWQCGQVQSMDVSGNAIEVSNWILAANGDFIKFEEALDTEQRSVQTHEISELRFLSGPSYSSLQLLDEQNISR